MGSKATMGTPVRRPLLDVRQGPLGVSMGALSGRSGEDKGEVGGGGGKGRGEGGERNIGVRGEGEQIRGRVSGRSGGKGANQVVEGVKASSNSVL